jgi:hypothetical protein
VKDEKNVFPLSKIPSNKAKPTRNIEASGGPMKVSSLAEREFVEAAKTHSVPSNPKVHADWRSLDPEQRPTRGINVRFNDYELALLRHLAEAQDRSMIQTIKRLLLPAAHEALEQADSLMANRASTPLP